MEGLKKGVVRIEQVIFTVERIFTALLLCIISVLVFLSAVMRKIGIPINWAQDFSLLCFAWLTFRVFNTLNLSYAWCTLCVPVGSILMMETLIHNTVTDIMTKSSDWGVSA